MIFSFGTSLAENGAGFAQSLHKMKGPKTAEKNAKSIDFIGVCAIRRRQTEKLFTRQCRPAL
jgi:hypothetical protein